VKIVVESAPAVPLVWFEVIARGGSAADPAGVEGLCHHMAELSRRGAGDRSREELDRALDQLGSSIHAVTNRDRLAFTGVCLAEHLDATMALLADVMARPHLSADEHHKLLTETRAIIDEIRDDDSALLERHYLPHWQPGHPYSRTALGTEASLAAIRLDEVRAAYRRQMVPDNLIIGFAGDVSERRAREAADQLVADLPTASAPRLPDVAAAAQPPGRRAVLVDKPERSQVQILLGHGAPPPSDPDYDALTVVETIFGGTFTSRLMQEIRVKHGWTYGVSCRLGRARGPLWLRIGFASAEEVAPAAIARVAKMYEELREHGIGQDELDFAHSYLAGSYAFSIATARDRLRVATDAAVCDLPEDFIRTLPARLAAVTLADTQRAVERWVRPGDLVTGMVATESTFASSIAELDLGATTVVPYDRY
jgi:zinc protease